MKERLLDKIKREAEEESIIHREEFNKFSEKYWFSSDDALDSKSLLNTIISGHLYIETIINDILAVIFRNPDAFKKFTFSQKVSVLDATKLLPDEAITMLRAINRLRNKFAHNLDYQPQLKEIQIISPEIVAGDWGKYPNVALRAALVYPMGYLSSLKVIIAKLKENKKIIL